MKPMNTEDLRPGMVLARTVINEDMVVILSENTLLTKAHITRLGFLNIPLVFVKDEYEMSANYQTVEAMFNRSNAFASQYQEVVSEVNDIFAATADNNSIPIEKTDNLIRQSITPLARQSGAIDYLYDLNHLASDVYNHSLRVAVLAGVIGKWLKMPSKNINELIMAGFLHDIGKTKFPDRLHNRRVETMRGDDFETYLQHTADGHHLLFLLGGA